MIILRYVIYEWSFRSDGQTYSTADQSLRLESKASFSNGHDVLGYYHSNQVSWSPQEIGFETQLRVYDQGDLVVFTQAKFDGRWGKDSINFRAWIAHLRQHAAAATPCFECCRASCAGILHTR